MVLDADTMMMGAKQTGGEACGNWSVERLRQQAETSLIDAARAGSAPAFTELVRRYSPRIYGYLRRRTPAAADAEDLLQETLIRAYENIDRFDSRSRFSTWLFTIAYRLTVSHYRKSVLRRTEPLYERATTTADPEENAIREEEGQVLWALTRRLPANQRRALELRYAAELPIPEVAEIMKMSRIHAKVLLFRARKGLAAIIEEYGGLGDAAPPSTGASHERSGL